jgi:hypothetical protein
VTQQEKQNAQFVFLEKSEGTCANSHHRGKINGENHVLVLRIHFYFGKSDTAKSLLWQGNP